MAKDTDDIRQDRSADRSALSSLMDDYLRDGGLISQVDWAGNVVGLATEAPSGPPRSATVLPFNVPFSCDQMPRMGKPAPTDKPKQSQVVPLVAPVKKAAPAPTVRAPETVAEWCERVAPAPTAVIIDIVPELRRIRADAERALARLNAAAERRTA